MNHTIEQAIGAIVLLLILHDVFLTVLHARAHMGPASYRIAHVTWRVFMTLSKPFGRQRGDEQKGVRDHISLRSGWDMRITRLAPALAYRMDEIDPAGNRTQTVDERRAFTEDLRSAV